MNVCHFNSKSSFRQAAHALHPSHACLHACVHTRKLYTRTHKYILCVHIHINNMQKHLNASPCFSSHSPVSNTRIAPSNVCPNRSTCHERMPFSKHFIACTSNRCCCRSGSCISSVMSLSSCHISVPSDWIVAL